MCLNRIILVEWDNSKNVRQLLYEQLNLSLISDPPLFHMQGAVGLLDRFLDPVEQQTRTVCLGGGFRDWFEFA